MKPLEVLDNTPIRSHKLAGWLSAETPSTAAPLPLTVAEARQRGWDELDVVFITGDAYVDHPSFAMAILGRVLESAGFRVGIVSQPEWQSCEPWRRFGRPKLFFAISAGNMDSMINHYTANRKVRNDDAYSPGGRIGMRPDRATLAYCQRAREAYKGVPIIAGGVEASLRRLAHYDYWSDKVRPSILLDSKADLVAFGMGEETIVEIARRLQAGQTVKQLRHMRGIAYAMGASETPPADAVELPGYDAVSSDKAAFNEATQIIHEEATPGRGRRLMQWHDNQAVVVNPPALPLDQASMDRIYSLPYTRQPHPAYREPIPAFQTIHRSVTIMRGCFGGCTFCSIAAHQGRIIQSRSEASIMSELRAMGADPEFKGTVSDIGGPTANMYQMQCTRPEREVTCRRQSCLYPNICQWLRTDHGPLIHLMRSARQVPGVKKVLVASGIRMDLARRSPEYIRELARYHVGGLLKVAPEHTDTKVLECMHKTATEDLEEFSNLFYRESKAAGKKQHLVLYLMAGHPGSDLDAMINLAVDLKLHGDRPDQVQDFIPGPMDVATAMYYTGRDPFTDKPVYCARKQRERTMQRALVQFFKPENYFEVRRALEQAGRDDLIGNGQACLIPAKPPPGALSKRGQPGRDRQLANKPGTKKRKGTRKQGRHKPGKGYRPRRKER